LQLVQLGLLSLDYYPETAFWEIADPSS